MKNLENYIEFKCEQCGILKTELKCHYLIHKNHFCSVLCKQKFGSIRKNNLLNKICLYCGIKFIGKDIRNKFCCRSHGSIYRNIKYKSPNKDKIIKTCKSCGIKIYYKTSHSTCTECTFINYSKLTLKELYDKYKGNQLSARNTIRSIARKNIVIENKCKVCDYSRHTELCHIKPICKFDLGSTIEQINNLSNLVRLCPTHHWELDNGFLFI